MKNIGKKEIILLLVIIIIAGFLAVYGLSIRGPKSSVPSAEEAADIQSSVSVENSNEENKIGDTDITEAQKSALTYLENNPAESYLLVTTSSGTHSPIPLAEETSFTINYQGDEFNTIHIGKNYFFMEESSCENQNCIEEGTVSLENRESRVLYNMVLCLPHNLSLELLDRDEAYEALTEMYEIQAAVAAQAGNSNASAN